MRPVTTSPSNSSTVAPGMHGAILSTSSSTSHARSGGTGTVKEWSSSMLISSHSLWLDLITDYAGYRSATAKTPTVCQRPYRRNHTAQAVSRTEPHRSGGVQDLESLGQAAVRQAGLARRAGQPLPQASLQVHHLAGLALMGAQGRDLARERVGHVHVMIGCPAAGDPDLTDGPRGEGLTLAEFGERERVARIRVDGVQSGGADRAVVGVADTDPVVVPL